MEPRFFTKSFDPAKECIRLQVPTIVYRNCSLRYWCKRRLIALENLTEQNIREFVREQLAISQEVNSSVYMVYTAVSKMRLWKGNVIIDDLVWKDCLTEYVGQDLSEYLKYAGRSTSWMYCDDIEEILEPTLRSKAKRQAREGYLLPMILDHIKESVEEYKELNYEASPYKKELMEFASISRTVVDKHAKEGKDYISKTASTKERIIGYRKVYPNNTQSLAANDLNLSIRTIKRYWNEK